MCWDRRKKRLKGKKLWGGWGGGKTSSSTAGGSPIPQPSQVHPGKSRGYQSQWLNRQGGWWVGGVCVCVGWSCLVTGTQLLQPKQPKRGQQRFPPLPSLLPNHCQLDTCPLYLQLQLMPRPLIQHHWHTGR